MAIFNFFRGKGGKKDTRKEQEKASQSRKRALEKKEGLIKEKTFEEKQEKTKGVKIAGKTKYNWQKDILLEPILTEKTNKLLIGNVVVFKVLPKANRQEVKQAVEKIFNVKVEKVNIVRMKSRTRGRTRMPSHRPLFKKALITLRQGYKIPLFE